jgi:hypothetical protein
MWRRPEVAIAAVAAALAVAVLVTPLGSAIAEPFRLRAEVAHLASREPPPSGQSGLKVPAPSQEQIARARQVLDSDPRVQALLRGRSYSVQNAAPVVDSDSDDPTLLRGIHFILRLAEPVPVEGMWLLKHDDRTGPVAVPEFFPTCAAPNGVSMVTALVLLLPEPRLVGFEPLPDPVAGHPVGSRDCGG